jgi:arylsulfatase A-like enzyme
MRSSLFAHIPRKILTAGSLAFLTAGVDHSYCEEARKPDVVLIVCDDFNPFYTGFAGDPDVKTPNLDNLAKESAVFSQCYSMSAVCAPSRTSLITGRYPHNTGCWGNTANLFVPPSLTTLFSDFQKTGYRTAMIGKTHWVSGQGYRREFANLEDYYKGIGIDHYRDVSATFETIGANGRYEEYLRKIGKYDAQVKDLKARLKKNQYEAIPSLLEAKETGDWMITDLAAEFFRQTPTSQPYMMMLGFSNPHSPMDPSGDYAKMYDPATLRLRENVKAFQRGDTTVDIDEIRKVRAAYLGKISFLDDLVGRLIKDLKERGTWDNTILVFTADHGLMVGEHGRISKGQFWEESIRVPMLVRIPGVTRGTRTEALSQFQDIYPTLIEAVGGTPSPGLFARSQYPVLRGDKSSVRDAVFAEITDPRTGALNYMVRKGKFKWFKNGEKEFLFDLEADPFEQTNLIQSPDFGETATSLRERLRVFLMTDQINYSAGYKTMEERMREKEPKDD